MHMENLFQKGGKGMDSNGKLKDSVIQQFHSASISRTELNWVAVYRVQ